MKLGFTGLFQFHHPLILIPHPPSLIGTVHNLGPGDGARSGLGGRALTLWGLLGEHTPKLLLF